MLKKCAAILGMTVLGLTAAAQVSEENWELFREIMALVTGTYVEQKAPGDVMAGALEGLARATGPESGYVRKEKLGPIEAADRLEWSLPLYVTKEDGFARVISPFAGLEDGVESGDILRFVGGKSAFDMSYPELAASLKGAQEAEVACGFMKRGTFKAFEKKLRLCRFVKPSVLKVGQKAAALRLPCLEALPERPIAEALSGITGTVILDLRNCASADVRQALKWSGFLFGSGELRTSSKGGETRLSFGGEGVLSGKSVVVLFDGTTARGGEVVVLAAGPGAKKAGRDTFGVAAVHETLELKNSDRLTIVTGYFLDRDGAEVKAKPIAPDIRIEDMKSVSDENFYLEVLSKTRVEK